MNRSVEDMMWSEFDPWLALQRYLATVRLMMQHIQNGDVVAGMVKAPDFPPMVANVVFPHHSNNGKDETNHEMLPKGKEDKLQSPNQADRRQSNFSNLVNSANSKRETFQSGITSEASYTSRSTTTPYSLPSSSPEIFKPRPTPSLQDDSRVDMSSNRRSPLHNFRRTPSCSSYDLHDLGETEVHRLNNNGHRRKSKRLLTCSECNYVSDRKNNLVRHIASMHTAKNERSFYCCDQFFATKCEQQRHKKLHHKNGFQCRLCGNKFARKPLLDRHLKGHHGELDVMKLQCQHCEYRTGSRAKMEHHMSTLHRTLSHATEIHL